MGTAPQELIFTDPETARIFGRPGEFVRMLYAMLTVCPIPENDARRTVREFSRPGIERAMPRYFNSSSFRKEWLDRRTRLIKAWSFPVMILQGYHDSWQPREFYQGAEQYLSKSSRVEFVDASHYYPFENPSETTAKIREFLRTS